MNRSELRAERIVIDGHACQWPECDITGSDNLEMAHLEQLSQGGADELGNVVMLCRYHHGILDGRSVFKRRQQTMILLRAFLRESESNTGIFVMERTSDNEPDMA